MEKEAEKKKLGEELKQFNKALVKVQDQYLEEARKNKAEGIKPTQKQKDLQKEMKEMQVRIRGFEPNPKAQRVSDSFRTFSGTADTAVRQAADALGSFVARDGDRHSSRAERP